MTDLFERHRPVNPAPREPGVAHARRVSVTDGTRALGIVIERDDGFQAIDLEGRIIGTYRSEPAAATELWRRDRRLSVTDKETRSDA